MRLLVATFALLAVATPSFAADDIDIMNPYKTEQQRVTDESLKTSQDMHNRWYDYVKERYGGEIERPAADAYVKTVKEKKKTDAPFSKDDEKKLAEARAFFTKYKIASINYDPKLGDLYADDANIELIFIHQSGARKSGSFSIEEYKKNMNEWSEKARRLGMTIEFKDVTYDIEDDGVRINALQTVGRARYNRPFTGKLSLLIEPQGDSWVITEDVTEMPFSSN